MLYLNVALIKKKPSRQNIFNTNLYLNPNIKLIWSHTLTIVIYALKVFIHEVQCRVTMLREWVKFGAYGRLP